MRSLRSHRRFLQLLALALTLALMPASAPAAPGEPLPALVFVARAHLATQDYIFRNELGPPGQLTTGVDKFAPGSKLIIREPDGRLRVLIDTAKPPGDPLNPLGLRDLQSPDVSFDATKIVFAGTTGPYLFADNAGSRPRSSWRLYEISADGTQRQLTYSNREVAIPEGLGNAEAYSFYDDLFPAYLADGRIVFSSSRYPSVSHYDGRPSYNLYIINGDGSNLHRITTERGGALHPTPLPDGRILFSRWWINFNQPSETGIYSRIDNGSGSEPVRDREGKLVTVERRVLVQPTAAPAARAQPQHPAPQPTPRPQSPSFVDRLDLATGKIIRMTTTPVPRPPATPTPRVRPTTPPAPARAAPREEIVRVPLTGYRLDDGTLVYSNTDASFRPAPGRLPDGTYIRNAPNTWHLMAITSDGADLRRFAWTPRYRYHLTTDDGLDSYNAAQPALIPAGNEFLVAYTSQRDSTMAHTSLLTGIRVAYPGIDQIANNTTESIAGMRWEGGDTAQHGYALHPAGLPDGRILFSQSVPDQSAPQLASYRFTQNGRTFSLKLQGAALRYELRTMRPDGSQEQAVPVEGNLAGFDLLGAKPVIARPVGDGPGQWRMPVDTYSSVAADNPLDWNVPRGLLNGQGKAAYPWSAKQISDVALVTIHNPNVYANPPLTLPFVNNSPPLGSVAYADIYIDATQFSGASYRADFPDDQVRAVKWLTVPVDAQGAFTASAPADTPVFIVLRDSAGRVVRGGNRSSLAIAQGNAPGRSGQVVQCVGCHMGHTSGSLDSTPLAALGWTNIAPAAQIEVSSSRGEGAERLNDRRNFVLAPGASAGGSYQDRTPPWIAAGRHAIGEQLQLNWSLPVAILDVRLVGVEPGQEGFSADYRISGELRFFLQGEELGGTRQSVGPIAPLGEGGTTVKLERPIAADQVIFMVTAVSGSRNGAAPPAALNEIEVIGQGASPTALAGRPAQVMFPLMGR